MNSSCYACTKLRGLIFHGFPDMLRVIQQFETPEAADEVAKNSFDCQPWRNPVRI